MKSCIKAGVFFLLSIAVSGICTGQDLPLPGIHVRHITKEKGLRYNAVNCFLHDSRGYMWMGGFALQRYDGYRFRTYLDDGGSLRIIALAEDRQSVIWAGTSKGLYRYNAAGDRFELFQDSVLTPSGKKALDIVQLAVDARNNLWIAALNYMGRLVSGTKQVQDAAPLFNNLLYADARRVSADSNGNIWLAAAGEYGILRYNATQENYSHHTSNPGQEGIFDLKIQGLSYLSDKSGNIWICDGFNTRILYRFHTTTRKLFKYRLQCKDKALQGCWPPPDGLLLDSQGHVWVTMAEHFGVARYNAASGDFDYLYTSSTGTGTGNLVDNISIANPGGYLYADRLGGFWYGGLAGVNYFSPARQQFMYVNTLPGLTSAKDSGPQQVTTLNGLVKMNDGYFYGIFYGNGLWKFDNRFVPVQKIKIEGQVSELLWVVFSADGETLFFSDQYRSLLTYNIRTGSIQNLRNSGYPFRHTSAFLVADRQTVWLGHIQDGISRFNPQTRALQTFPFDTAGGKEPPSYVSSFIQTDNRSLWYGCIRGGLFLLNTVTGKVEKAITRLPGDQENLSVYGLEKYGRDTLVLATTSGLIFYHTVTGSVRRVTVSDGLPDNFIAGVKAEPEKKRVWFNTLHNGVGKLSLPDISVTLFPHSTGNLAEIGDLFSLRADKERLIFAANNGFSVFHLPRLMDETAAPAVHITEIRVNGVSLNTDSILRSGKKMVLTHQYNDINIRFSALNLWDNDAIHYYIKKGNGTWVESGGQAEVEYTDMPPGNYSFSFRCSYNKKSFGGETTLYVRIDPPFLKSPLFYYLLGGMLLVALYSIYRFRLQRIRKQEKEKSAYRQQLQELEIKALRSQMNPHFIFNSLNAINRYILKANKEEASSYLSRFSKLIRLILENSKAARIPLSKEIQALELYLEMEALRFQQHFMYSIQLEENLSPDILFIPPMVIQPFAENAIWHGLLPKTGNCELLIRIYRKENRLLCDVEDNGIGRAKSALLQQQEIKEKTAVGMAATEQRLRMMTDEAGQQAGEVKVEDIVNTIGEIKGTRVRISMPLLYGN